MVSYNALNTHEVYTKNTRGGESEGEMCINNSIVSFFIRFLSAFVFFIRIFVF